MTSPLLNNFGYLAQGPETAEVLDGTYVPPSGTDIYARNVLKEL
jgi:hypothetical protein